MKTALKTFAAIGLLAVAGSSFAVPITGSIGFSGAYIPLDMAGGSQVALGVANHIDIVGNTANVTGTVTGSFATAGITAGDVATYSDFDFDPTGPVAGIWSIGSFTFDLNTMVNDFQNNSLLGLSGTGKISSTDAGLDDAFGRWTFTANAAGSNFTFSSSTAPEPGIALLLGAGLVGLGFARRFRNKA